MSSSKKKSKSKKKTKKTTVSRKKTNRSKPSRDYYSIEEKKKWLSPHLSEKEAKFCRCLLIQHANELERYGKKITNSYAICMSSVGTKKKSGSNLRSKLAKKSLQGMCSKNLHFTNLPTKLLYAYAMLRKDTKKNFAFFKFVPDPKIFFQNPEHYRMSLLRAITQYKISKQKKLSKKSR